MWPKKSLLCHGRALMRAIPRLPSAKTAKSYQSQFHHWQSASATSSGVPGDTNVPLSPKTSSDASPGAAASQLVDSCTALHCKVGISPLPAWECRAGSNGSSLNPVFSRPGPTSGMAGPSLGALGSAPRVPVTRGSRHSPPASSLEPAQTLLFSVLKSHQTL